MKVTIPWLALILVNLAVWFILLRHQEGEQVFIKLDGQSREFHYAFSEQPESNELNGKSTEFHYISSEEPDSIEASPQSRFPFQSMMTSSRNGDNVKESTESSEEPLDRDHDGTDDSSGNVDGTTLESEKDTTKADSSEASYFSDDISDDSGDFSGASGTGHDEHLLLMNNVSEPTTPPSILIDENSVTVPDFQGLKGKLKTTTLPGIRKSSRVSKIMTTPETLNSSGNPKTTTLPGVRISKGNHTVQMPCPMTISLHVNKVTQK